MNLNNKFLDALLSKEEEIVSSKSSKSNKSSKKLKDTKGKPDLSLIPDSYYFKLASIKAREYGIKKYGEAGRDGWVNNSTEEYHAALNRHAEKCMNDLFAVDSESGLPHIFHMLSTLSFIISKEKDGKLKTWLN